MRHSPSLIATAVVVQALYIITGNGWNDSLEHYSGYSWTTVQPVVAEIQLLHQCSLTSSHQTVLEKYKGKNYATIFLNIKNIISTKIFPSGGFEESLKKLLNSYPPIGRFKRIPEFFSLSAHWAVLNNP